jgi:anti-sigma regulatory factor (Ser/Thr protein kinase)
MVDDAPLDRPAGPGNKAGQAILALDIAAASAPPVLDVAFDSGTLYALRAQIHAHARQAGLPDSRAGDVMLAVHELAANAVRHGAGAGRLRIWNLAGVLHCQVDDGGALASSDPAWAGSGQADSEATKAQSASSLAAMDSWQATPGHGLWVVRQVADQMQVLSGPRGTRATVRFGLRPQA